MVLSFGLARVSSVFTSLTKPILFIYQHMGFHIIVNLDDIFDLICFNCTSIRVHTF